MRSHGDKASAQRGYAYDWHKRRERDAYATRGGSMSEQQCTAIIYHADFGQVCRKTVTPEMLTAA